MIWINNWNKWKWLKQMILVETGDVGWNRYDWLIEAGEIYWNRWDLLQKRILIEAGCTGRKLMRVSQKEDVDWSRGISKVLYCKTLNITCDLETMGFVILISRNK